MLWMKPCTYIAVSKISESQIPWNCLLAPDMDLTSSPHSSYSAMALPAEWPQFCCSPVLFISNRSFCNTRLKTYDPCVHILGCVDENNPPLLHEGRQKQGCIQNKKGVREKSKNSWRRKWRSKLLIITTPWV